MMVFHLFDSSKSTASLTASFLRRQAGSGGIAFGHLQVGADFSLQFRIEAPLPEQRQ
jgi:hypothetical protein